MLIGQYEWICKERCGKIKKKKKRNLFSSFTSFTCHFIEKTWMRKSPRKMSLWQWSWNLKSWVLNIVIVLSPAFNNGILNKGKGHLFTTYGEVFINEIQIYLVSLLWDRSKPCKSFAFVINGWSFKPFFLKLKLKYL